MKKLMLALYSEGVTDQRFLPDVIRRTCRGILDLRTLYALLGRQVNLERLSEVPAYQQFVNDLTETLKKLNLVQQ